MSRLDLLRDLLSVDFWTVNNQPSAASSYFSKDKILSPRLQIQHNFYFFLLTRRSPFSEHFRNILLAHYACVDGVSQMDAHNEETRDSRKYKQDIILAPKEPIA